VFAQALATRGQNVVLVARSRDKLENLANELQQAHSVTAKVMVFDLTSPSAGQQLAQQLRDRKLDVTCWSTMRLGVRGPFQTLPLQRQMEMVRLNNDAVVELT